MTAISILISVLLNLAGVLNSHEEKGTLVITVTGTQAKGKVLGCLFNTKEGWPENYKKSYRQFSQVAANSSTVITITGLPYGTYAVIAMQDEDGNGVLTKKAMGIPTEKYGASRDARNTMRAPDYENAVFTFNKPEQQISFGIKYSKLL